MAERLNVLVIGVDRELGTRAAPPLLRKIFDIDRIPTVEAALELVRAVHFAALIVRYPPPGMPLEVFMKALRQPTSASRQTPVLLLATSHDEAEKARSQSPAGVRSVLSLEDPPEERERELCDVLGIPPRSSTRVLVKLDVNLSGSKHENLVAQMRDISATGMFVTTPKRYPVGSLARFEFSLPGSPQPFTGRAEVARHSRPEVDAAQGMGFRFITVDGARDRELKQLVLRLDA